MAVFSAAESVPARSPLSASHHDGVYRPILRPRRGEMAALSHLPASAASRVLPILELDTDTDLLPLIRELPPRTNVAVDFGEIIEPADPLVTPSLDLAEQLAQLGVSMVPVLRAHESRRRLAVHGLAARLHLHQAVLRFQPHLDAANPAQADVLVDRLLRGTGLDPEEIDLLIDFAETACVVHAERFEDQLRRILRWAGRRAWRSISVASGAMPANLDELPTDRPVMIDRHDARVWARIGEPGVGYADYGVTSPVRRRGVSRHRQLPTLRYTAEHNWWIYRWSRRGGRSDDRCHDLCRSLVSSPHWPAAGARFSWGDAEIARRARSAPGAGSPAGWMSWSTSHHIAHVLRTLGP